MTSFLVGITGGTGSGKSMFAKKLRNKVKEDVLIIHQDMYYKDQSHEPLEERKKKNMDCPEALDFALLRKHLKKLSQGKSIDSPLYDFITHTRRKETKKLEPASVIIVEGLLVLADPKFCKLLDLKIYIDVDSDLRVARRILRDVKEGRDKSLEESIEQYLTSAYPMHRIFVEPQKRKADLVIPWNKTSREAVETVAARIEAEIRERNGINSNVKSKT